MKSIVDNSNGTKDKRKKYSPSLIRALYKEAMSLYRTCQYAQSGIILDKLIVETDDVSLQSNLIKYYHSRAWRKHSEQMILIGNYDSAVQALQKSVTSIPCSTGLIIFLANCFAKSQNSGAENTGMDNAGIDGSVDAESAKLFKESASLYLSGKVDQAIEILQEKLIPSYPSNFEINYYLGIILAGQDKPFEAIKYLTKAVRLRPEHSDVHWKLGLAHASVSHIPESLHHLQQAHNLDPSNNWILSHLVLSALQGKRFGVNFDIKLNSIDNYESVGESYALNKLSELIAREPEFVTAFLELPKTDVDKEIFSSLLQIILRALENYPEYADLHYHCSCVWDRLGNTDNAILQTQQALEINPRYINALIYLAKLYQRTNRCAEAIDRLQQAIAYGANYADVHYMLAEMYRKQGRISQAKEHYERAIEINRNYGPAKQALELMTI